MSTELWIQTATGVIELPHLDGLCLAGFSGRKGAPQGVDQSLELNALLLSTAKDATPFIVVSGDLLYFGAALRDAVRSWLRGNGFDPHRLLLLASHTHYAPSTDASKSTLGMVDPAFVAYVAMAVADLVMKARAREPARTYMCHARVQAAHALHRRRLKWHFERRPPFVWRRAYMGPNPFYRLRDDLDVVLFETADREPLACFWSYSCHPSAYPRKLFVHADYVGVVRAALRRCLGDSLPVVFAQGAAGDIRPDTRSSRPSLLELFRTFNDELRFTPFTIAEWTCWADGLASGITDMLNRRQCWTRLNPCLSYAETKVALSDIIDGVAHEGSDLRLVALQFGKQFRLLVMSAEPVNKYRRIFASGDVSAHLTVGYEGAVFGYLPTERMLKEGGYEVQRFFPHFGLRGSFRSGFESTVIAAGRQALRQLTRTGT